MNPHELDFSRLVDDFLTAKAGSNRSAGTLYIYNVTYQRYQEFCFRLGYSGLDLITPEVIEEFFTDRLDQGIAEATVNQYYCSLRALFRWAQKRKLVAENPIELIEAPRVTSKLPKRITYNEVMQLLVHIKGQTWLDHRDRLAIQVLFFCGMRRGEFINMRVGDVNLTERLLLVRRIKTKVEEYVPFPRSIQADMQRWIGEIRPAQPHDYLWVSNFNRGGELHRMKPMGLQQMIRRRCEQAGLPTYTPHSFRHGCAVRIIEVGGDITLVQKILGHRQLTTTQHYLRFDVSGLVGLYDRVFA